MTYGLSDKFSNEQSDIEPNRKHLKGNNVRRCIGFWVYMGNGHCITVITDFLTISLVDRLHPEAPTRRICAAKTVWLVLHAGPGPKVGQASVQHQHWESGIIVTKWDHSNKVENPGLSPVAQYIWNTHWRGEWLKEADNLWFWQGERTWDVIVQQVAC